MLGVGDGDGWDVVRLAYRAASAAHPRRARRGATSVAARLNEAYAVLSRAKRPAWRPRRLPGAPHRPPPAPPGPAARACAVGGDTLPVAAPPDEAFALLLEAATAPATSATSTGPAPSSRWWCQDDETCLLVVTLQGRAYGTEGVSPASHGAAGEPAARPRRRPSGGLRIRPERPETGRGHHGPRLTQGRRPAAHHRRRLARAARSGAVRGGAPGRHRAGVHRHLLGHQGRGHLPLRRPRAAVVLVGHQVRLGHRLAQLLGAARRRHGQAGQRHEPRHGAHRGPLRTLRLAPGPSSSTTVPDPPGCATA